MTITERQTEIIEAAAKILTNAGVSGLTIKNIAKEMNFSESAIYRHFESKEDIILTMLDFVINSLGTATLKTLLNNESVTDTFKAIFKAQFAYFAEHPYLAIVIFSDGLLEESTRINNKITMIMSSRKIMLEPLAEKGQQNGELTNEIPAEDIIHILMGSVRLLMYQWRVSHFSFDIQTKGNSLVNNLIKIIHTK
jgi:AcrR family transcriptional regulator